MWLLLSIIITGFLALVPAVDVNEPETFYLALCPCPKECDGTPESWTVYSWLDRLRFCKQPMLLDFAIHNSLEGLSRTVKLRTCTSGDTDDVKNTTTSFRMSHDQRSADDQMPTCFPATQFKLPLKLFLSTDIGSAVVSDLQTTMDHLKRSLADSIHCTTSFLVGYHNQAVVAVYSGSAIENVNTLPSVMNRLLELVGTWDHERLPKSIIMQLCGDDRNAAHTFGISVDTTGDLAADKLDDINIYEIPLFNQDTPSGNNKSTLPQFRSGLTLPVLAPTPGLDGSCESYNVGLSNFCAAIANAHGITVTQLEGFNDGKTWGWNGCDQLVVGLLICLSEGTPPLPAPVSNALCGPIVPGTRYLHYGQTLSDLNPCPLNACCDIWGQYGNTLDHCLTNPGPRGNPASRTRIPIGHTSIAYYESWNWDRPCLNYRVSEISAVDPFYTHIHWAFAIVGGGFNVVVNDRYRQWYNFLSLPEPTQKVISFGGWGRSADAATYDKLRQSMYPRNVDIFVTSIINFMDEYKLDGVHIEWEYPGVTAVPGIPLGQKTDAPNYLAFLKKIAGKAAHGQSFAHLGTCILLVSKGWDFNNGWSQEGCPSGSCPRSHVNFTETLFALSMLNKAGLDASKVVVAYSSYGRSYRVIDRSACERSLDDIGCRFTGPYSNATPGVCTGTAGYLSNAEINEIVTNEANTVVRFDEASHSITLLYGPDWVSFLTDDMKKARLNYYLVYRYAGVADWAIDLQAYTDDDFDPHGEYDLPDTSLSAPCNGNYQTLEELDTAAETIPAHCITIYTLIALNNLLKRSLSDYNDMMSDGYDRKFKTYAKEMAKTAGDTLQSFITENGNKYFSCIVTEPSVCCKVCVSEDGNGRPSHCSYCFEQGNCYSMILIDGHLTPFLINIMVNQSEPYPPDYSKRGFGPDDPFQQTVYWTLLDEAGFYADLESSMAIPRARTKIGTYNRTGLCPSKAAYNHACWYIGYDFNVPVINGYTASDVLDPKEVVLKALTNAQSLGPQIETVISQL
ncbi:Killer toxin subunits alpha/beta-like protein [Cladobotryum mycophilum]|uniref:chitinase n=1 Tax=Cladobotryum mycophilum TaxID=491253 RepID=A0ABR0STB8_9HYPO